MHKPTQAHVDDCITLVKEHYTQYGNTATETRLQALIYSIHAIMTGDGKPAESHAQAIEEQSKAAHALIEDDEGDEFEDGEDVDGDGEFEDDEGEGDPTADGNEELAEEGDPADEWTADELAEKTIPELKQFAEEGEVALTSDMNKAQIIAAIMAAH